MPLLLGYDLGSSSIKATLMQADTGVILATATSPEKELEIIAEKPGWAEQHPEIWWENIKAATQQIKAKTQFDLSEVEALGISYQMHGLVVVNKKQEVLRPAIIWCDSRAVQIGRLAAKDMGEQECLETLLNLPGNFTASKLKWVMENEPTLYSQIYKIMLPGDYIAMKMSGQIATTASGLSEGIMWDFQKQGLAQRLLDHYGIDQRLIADVVETFCVQSRLSKKAGEELGLKAGTKISYRGGDQPNNALSLKVLEPGEVAATAGTSGVVCAISEKPNYDSNSRVNTFVHVNHTSEKPRFAVLLCVNGAGILNSWLKHNFTASDERPMTYEQMNELAARAPLGSDGLVVLPYGNGAERTLGNKNVGAAVHGWHFNTHSKAHFLRAGQEGIAFALNHGLEIIREMGITLSKVRAGHANMFLSPLFAQTFASLTQTTVELYNTDGSQGAARGAGIGAGIYKNMDEAFVGLEPIKTIEPEDKLTNAYRNAYENWKEVLDYELDRASKKSTTR